MDSTQRIEQLEAKVAELTALIGRTSGGSGSSGSSGPAPAVDARDATDPTDATGAMPVSSRRGMLKLAGAAAAGAAVSIVAKPGVAAAVDGDPVSAGKTTATTDASRETTALVYTNSVPPEVDGAFPGTKAAANIFVARDTSAGLPAGSQSSSNFPAAVAGYSFRTVANGMYGFTANTGYGVVGAGGGTTSIGGLFRGTKSNLQLTAEGAAGPARIDAHTKGELLCDANGDLWYCTTDGTPGVWRKLSGPASSGAFHAITPARVYDSRAAAPAPGALTNNANRLISVADKRNLTTGAVTTADIVPPRATAIACNVTVVNTVGSGFLLLNPGGDTTVGAAMVNWSASGQILNNGVLATLNGTRQLTVICGGGGSTDFVLDVTGYFI
ncbi:MAG TPA: hypothetical protein VIT64_03920 [Ilumatobacteraceae bacterium]